MNSNNPTNNALATTTGMTAFAAAQLATATHGVGIASITTAAGSSTLVAIAPVVAIPVLSAGAVALIWRLCRD